jgi:hypothetical protein
MTLQERIESFATMSATMLAQLNELSALHEKVRLAEAAVIKNPRRIGATR